jgi:charged multivesicular body protein 4
MCREELREQHAIGEEIGEAITQSIGNQALDDGELDAELEALQQEELDNKMLTTGSVPVGDKVGTLPAAPQGGSYPRNPHPSNLFPVPF